LPASFQGSGDGELFLKAFLPQVKIPFGVTRTDFSDSL
jgi:hypothetical protein